MTNKLLEPTFIGAGSGGHMFKGHAEPGAKAGLRLAAVYDPSNEATDFLLSQPCVAPGAVAYHESFWQMLEEHLLGEHPSQAVVIASPDKFHAGQLLETVNFLVEHRLFTVPVLVDKPLSINKAGLDQVRAAIELVQDYQIPLAGCYVRDFDNAYIWIRENFRGIVETIGDITKIVLRFSYPVPRKLWKSDERQLWEDHFEHELRELLRLFPGAVIQMRLRRSTASGLHYYASGTLRTVEGQVIEFEFIGDRNREQPKKGFGLFHETVRLESDQSAGVSFCEIDTHIGDATFDTGLQRWREPAAASNHDGRVEGGMRQLRNMIDGQPSSITPDAMLALAEADYALGTTGCYTNDA